MRRKEKKLSLEEIREKLIDAGKDLWLHSSPIYGFGEFEGKYDIICLDPKLFDKLLVVFLVEVSEYSAQNYLATLEKWNTLYHGLNWQPIIAIRDKYHFIKFPKFYDRFRKFASFYEIPTILDSSGEWFKHYQTDSSKVSLSEVEFQDELRKKNPGLPLKAPDEGNVSKLPEKEIQFTDLKIDGFWKNQAEYFSTQENNASISFEINHKATRIIATAFPHTRESSKAYIYLNDEPLPKELYGEHVHLGDRGQAILEINKHTGIFELTNFESPLAEKGTLKIKFLNTFENPVAIYGLRSLSFS